MITQQKVELKKLENRKWKLIDKVADKIVIIATILAIGIIFAVIISRT